MTLITGDPYFGDRVYTLLYYSTGKLAPEKVIVVVPLEQVRKEGSRVSLHCGSEWYSTVWCTFNLVK